MSDAFQQDLPGGMVTFLFTDIEGSTRLLADIGDEYAAVLELHRSVLRGIWQEFGGYVVDAVGDSFLVVFSSALAAVSAAIAAQQEIETTQWPMSQPLRIRMGIHTGFAMPRKGTYVAMAVHQTARLINAAHGGQVLVTEASRESLSEELKRCLEKLGRFRVRDFDSPQLLYRVIAQGWQDSQKPPRVRPAEQHNMPRPPLPMIGRDAEMASLSASIAPGTLTSLLGPGGIGKSRLAIELGLGVVDHWPDGVWMIPLEALQDLELVPEMLAEALSMSAGQSAASLDGVLEFLEQRQALIILDNCEHVVTEVAELVTALRGRCPMLGLLTTTQVPLGIRGENVIRLRPLSTTANEMRDEPPAVELFLQRASELQPSEMPAVKKLCERLEGMPLAIEIAAARASSMPPSSILSQLDTHIDVLRINDPGLAQRHRSMTDILLWSISMLSDDERDVLDCLTVFAGDFGLKSAQAVASTAERNGVAVTTHLWSLVEKSLVWLDETTGGSRFRLSMSVKMAAWQRLDEPVRHTIIRQAGAHYLDCFPPLDAYKTSWNRRIAEEWANVRAVVLQLAGLDDETGQALSWCLVNYHRGRGAQGAAITEGLEYLKLYPDDAIMRLCLLDSVISSLEGFGATDEARAWLNRGMEIKARIGVPECYPTVLANPMAMLLIRDNEYSAALAVLGESLVLASSASEKCRLENTRGLALSFSGQNEEAIEAFKRSLAHSDQRKDGQRDHIVLSNLAEGCLILGRPAAAARWQYEALIEGRSQDAPSALANSLFIAARLLVTTEGYERAVAYSAAGSKLYSELGLKLYPADQESVDAAMTAARQHLGESTFSRAIETGESWSRTQAADMVADGLKCLMAAGADSVDGF